MSVALLNKKGVVAVLRNHMVTSSLQHEFSHSQNVLENTRRPADTPHRKRGKRSVRERRVASGSRDVSWNNENSQLL